MDSLMRILFLILIQVVGIINKFLDLNWEVYLKIENILYFGFIVKKT